MTTDAGAASRAALPEDGVYRWATISDDGSYRYALGRQWSDGAPWLGWVMLNPSTADAEQDDPTIRRCIGFAKAWRYGGILVGNVYAYRATDPRELDKTPDPIGPDNERYLTTLAQTCPLVVCAWGARADIWQAAHTRSLLDAQGTGVVHLGLTKGGQPRHPLYVRADQRPEHFA